MLENPKVLLVGTDPTTNMQRIFTLPGAAYVRAAANAISLDYPGAIPFQHGHFQGGAGEASPELFREFFSDYLSEIPSAGPDWAPDGHAVRIAPADPAKPETEPTT